FSARGARRRNSRVDGPAREWFDAAGPSDITQSKGGVKMRVRCVRVFLAALLVEGLYVVPAGAGSKNFVALLNGGQETPANNSGAFGVAFLTLSGNSLCYSISFTRLDGGAETNAHVHGPAAPGTPSSS